MGVIALFGGVRQFLRLFHSEYWNAQCLEAGEKLTNRRWQAKPDLVKFNSSLTHPMATVTQAVQLWQLSIWGVPKKCWCVMGGQQLQMVPFSKLHTPWVGALVHLVSASVFWILKLISCCSNCRFRFSHSSLAFWRSFPASTWKRGDQLVVQLTEEAAGHHRATAVSLNFAAVSLRSAKQLFPLNALPADFG